MYQYVIYFIKLCYFILPAAFANSMGTLTKWTKVLNVPVDMNRRIDGKRIFGDNKTWRGVIFGVLAGTLIALVQGYLYELRTFRSISMVDYSHPILLGFLMGLGDHVGDLFESFMKRRLDIRPGDPFIPFDQLDGPIGAMILSYPLTHISLKDATFVLLIWFVFHVITKHIGFWIGVDKRKW